MKVPFLSDRATRLLEQMAAKQAADDQKLEAERTRRPAAAAALAELERNRPASLAALVREREAAGIECELAEAAWHVALTRRGAADGALFAEGVTFEHAKARYTAILATGVDPRIAPFIAELDEMIDATRRLPCSSADVRREIVTDPATKNRTAYERTWATEPSRTRRLVALYAARRDADGLAWLGTTEEVSEAIARIRASVPEVVDECIDTIETFLGTTRAMHWEAPERLQPMPTLVKDDSSRDTFVVAAQPVAAPLGWMADSPPLPPVTPAT